jgi:hypothetical protein
MQNYNLIQRVDSADSEECVRYDPTVRGWRRYAGTVLYTYRVPATLLHCYIFSLKLHAARAAGACSEQSASEHPTSPPRGQLALLPASGQQEAGSARSYCAVCAAYVVCHALRNGASGGRMVVRSA